MVPVSLPKEVLALFPTWEYCCPSCGTYVESNVSFCPDCKTVFDETKWHVPPRFLNSYEAMSEYAHKVLAPKLNSEHRKLLFQYFTELFNDGFENGDFSAWTGTGGSSSVVASPVHCGSYSLKLGDGNCDYVYKTLASNSSSFFVRLYWMSETLPSSGDASRLVIIRKNDNTGLLRLFYENSGGTCRFRLENAKKTTDVGTYNVVITIDTWYCLEVGFIVDTDGTDGEAHFHLDGTERILSTTEDFDTVQAGKTYVVADQNGASYAWNNMQTYIDCFVVADTYIGPETAEQAYTKNWATDLLFKKLGNPRTISVNVALQKQDVLKSFGVDTAFQRCLTVQKVADVVFKRFAIQKFFGLDACFGGSVTKLVSSQFDVVFKRLGVEESFCVDCYFGSVVSVVCSKSFGLNVVFAYKVRLPELWLDENGKVVFNISKPYAWVGL